jgi:tetratricopeptide (TPR) repeat protein
MNVDLGQTAINLAVNGQWKEAIDANLAILKQNSKDFDAWNRLGRAYLETGHKAKAVEAYEKVLKLDKFNPIATKNLTLLKSIKVKQRTPRIIGNILPSVFLEEPGVTKTVSLIRPGDPKVLACMDAGQQVKIVSRGHLVVIVNAEGQYIGRLTDDLAARLRTFLTAGNTYGVWIKSLDEKEVKVFIREIKRVAKFRYTPSFPLTEKLTYSAFTPPELVHEEKPDVLATEFQDDVEVGSKEAPEDDDNEVNVTPLE